jgi:dienelactone hydrolase
MSYLWYWPHGGWDVDKWKASHAWRPIESRQSDHMELFPPMAGTMGRDEWEQEQQFWRSISDEMLGEVDDTPPQSMRWEFLTEPLERHGEPAVLCRRLRYCLTEQEWGYAWLLLPKDAPDAPRPAVIALHQTVMQGKNEPVGIEGYPGYTSGMDYGLLCARAGFAVLAPDAIGFGERAAEHSNAHYRSADQFFAAHPRGSVMAKMTYDVSRAVDLLEELPGIDSGRVGCIGHSHGGYGTIFAMIVEPRLRAGAISCGFTTLRTDPSPDRWWRRTALIPRLSFYENHIEKVPIDFHIWLSLIAPRPLFISAGLADQIFPGTDNIPQIVEMLRPIWALHDAADLFQARAYDGPHDFPAESRRRAVKLLQDALQGNG